MSKKKSAKHPPVAVTPENKCSFCRGSLCCSYITQRIDTPRSKDEFDHLLWQLAHREVQAYKDEDGWFLVVNNRCRHLLAEGGCGIYDSRPQICRDHSNDYCEYDAPAEDGFELFFADYDSLLQYCRKRFRNWDKRFTS